MNIPTTQLNTLAHNRYSSQSLQQKPQSSVESFPEKQAANDLKRETFLNRRIRSSRLSLGSGSITGGYTQGVPMIGGRLQTGSIATNGSSSPTFTLANSAKVIFNNSGTVRFSSSISGTGEVIQTGTGTTFIETDQSYTGPTTIRSGTFTVNARLESKSVSIENGGTLIARGHLSGKVVNSGIFHPDKSVTDRTPAIGGDYLQDPSGTLLIKIYNSPSASQDNIANDRIAISGQAQLKGTLKLQLDSGVSLQPGKEFTLLVASKGIRGTFDSIDAGRSNFQVLYSPQEVRAIFI